MSGGEKIVGNCSRREETKKHKGMWQERTGGGGGNERAAVLHVGRTNASTGSVLSQSMCGGVREGISGEALPARLWNECVVRKCERHPPCTGIGR